jgi:hypothetical protein
MQRITPTGSPVIHRPANDEDRRLAWARFLAAVNARRRTERVAALGSAAGGEEDGEGNGEPTENRGFYMPGVAAAGARLSP